MTTVEIAYLSGVVVAFVAFGLMLAWCSATSGGPRKTSGKDENARTPGGWTQAKAPRKETESSGGNGARA